jgi:REP element-mobilizing transposase RayT
MRAGGLVPPVSPHHLQGMSHQFALLETWTCHGQWLPGDNRGYVSNTVTEDGYRRKNNSPGTAYDRGNLEAWRRAKALQKHETILLSSGDARIAAEAMIQACVDREWLILQGAIMANHVHTVVTNCPDDGPSVRRVLKGTSQAAMSRHFGRPRKWWTEGGSDRYKHGEAAITAAVNYVTNQSHPLVFIVKNELVLPTTGTSPVAR